MSPLSPFLTPQLAQPFELVVETAGGCWVLPREVRTALNLQPGDLFSLAKNPLSLRLDSYREFLADNWEAVSPPNRWRYIEEFLRRPLTALEPDGAVKVPAQLLSLSSGDRIILEVVTRGLAHELFLYRLEG